MRDRAMNGSSLAVLARLGRTPVSGVGPDSLEAEIARSHRAFPGSSSIAGMLLRLVTVLGAGRDPARPPLDPTTTVADGLAPLA
ncbi:MAG TPA: hypothetical protein VGD56_04400 [Gemmatirosa sp.]